ncbi:MAG: HEAT repeat domain-containing protein [Akkermansiaceae bacterium]
MKVLPKSILIPSGIFILSWCSLVADPLPSGLGHWSPVVRAKAIQKTARAGAQELPGLGEALGSDHAGLRHAATATLSIIAKKNPPQPSPEWQAIAGKLVRLLQSDPEFWVRCGAASALQAIKFEATAPAVLTAAGDPDPWVAAAAVAAISEMPLKFFDSRQYLATAVHSLTAPRSTTRSSAIAMIGRIGADGKKALPQVEASIGTMAQDSMFADKPRIDAIIWISRFDKPKSAKLANGLLLEERWGAAGRYQRLLPFLETLGADAAPAAEGLRAVTKKSGSKNKPHAARAAKILAKLKS